MKTESYRRAVETVKWTAGQRMAIEARLSVPLHHPEDLADGYTESVIAISRELPREGSEMETKKPHKKKLWVIAAAAAALTVGGVSAGVAMRAHNKNSETVQQDESHPDLENTRPDNTEEVKALGLHLSGADSVPDCKINVYNNFIETESENGWYHVMNSKQYGKSILCYTDKESGETIPLCANPECKHDGSIYCTASTNAYIGGSLCWADGSLWCGSQKNPHPEQDMKLDDFAQAHAVLLQYAPDGSSIKEAADFGAGSISRVIYHRGCLFFWVEKQIGDSVTVFNEITKQNQTMSTSGYELIAYDLTAKKAVTVLSRMPEPGSFTHNQSPNFFCCAGDYLYYEMMLSSPEAGFYRVSLLTGEVEQVLEGARSYVYCISRNDMLYTRPCPDNPTQTESALMHLDTLESDVLTEFALGSDPAVAMVMDDSYFYARYYDLEKETWFVQVHEKTGRQIGEIALPQHQYLEYLAVRGDRMFAVMQGTVTTKDGQAFMMPDTNKYLCECSIKDALAGKTEWKTVYCLDDTLDGGNDHAE
ncbi:MAG: hypothetical protein IK130_01500 [Oscillospiraceae bacterium]|nr:hypothetical protein [Oscillospiraceae bacterium]